jgi:hypothetical protein
VQGTPGTVGLRISSAEAGEGEGDESVPMRASPGHDRWWRSDAAAQAQREHRRRRERAQECGEEVRGWPGVELPIL